MATSQRSSTSQRYPTPQYRRSALLPGIIGAIAALAGVAAIGQGIFTLFLYLVSIFALIVLVLAAQARQCWWLPLLAAVAILFNPVFPLSLPDLVVTFCSYGAAVVFILTAVFVKVVNKDDRNKR
jgi:hypothetical protein